MSNGPESGHDNWPQLLRLAAHEIRTPTTVVLGYIRMLLKDSAGPLNDKQRRLLEEAQKSATRLSEIATEMSDVAKLEEGELRPAKRRIELGSVLQESIASLPPMPDRAVEVELDDRAPGAAVDGDRDQLRRAFAAILWAVRREQVTSSPLVVRVRRAAEGGPSLFVSIAAATVIDSLDDLDRSGLRPFEEIRGGCGLAPSAARRVLGQHGGRVWSPADNPKASAVMMLPELE